MSLSLLGMLLMLTFISIPPQKKIITNIYIYLEVGFNRIKSL